MSPTEHGEELRGWFTGRLPADWFSGRPEITVDREEVVVIGSLDAPAVDQGASDAERAAAAAGRIKAVRGQTRGAPVRIAREAEAPFGRKVAWGAVCGD